MGLDEGYPPHLQDTMDILDEVQRKDISPFKLDRCWKKSTLLNGHVNYPHPNTLSAAAPVALAPSVAAPTTTPVAPSVTVVPAASAPVDDELANDNADKDDTAEIINRMMKLASFLVINKRNISEETSDNEMEFIFDELVETISHIVRVNLKVKEGIAGRVGING